MDVVAAKGLLAEFKGDTVALGVFEREEKGKVPELFITAKRIDAKAGGILAESLKKGEFTGKLGAVATYHARGLPMRLILLIGLGKRSEFEPDAVRQAAAKACCAARELGVKKLGFCVDSVVGKGVDLEVAGRLLTEGAILGLYRFEAYKTEKEKKEVESLHLITSGNAKALAEGACKGEIIASSANLAREICNDPGNYATPEKLAKFAQGIAAKYGFKCKVLGKREIEKEKLGGILSVSAGSHQPPAFVILEYNGPKSAGKKPIVLIGKGITFDSGGISIKPSKDMEKMKFDKAGACAIFGAFAAAARLRAPLRLIGLAPLVENLPGGEASRPGDIIRMHSGKTVEIISTDAEGRVILGDALSYSARFKPKAILDLATLTGACVAALGYECSGLLGNDETLLAKVESAGGRSGERVWRLPMWKAYNEYNRSDNADIKNVGPPSAAGTICGAKFLEAFVPKGVPWAHVDIAATAWNDKPSAYMGLGATGVGVRLIAALLDEL